jgi:hypothetical protein
MPIGDDDHDVVPGGRHEWIEVHPAARTTVVAISRARSLRSCVLRAPARRALAMAKDFTGTSTATLPTGVLTGPSVGAGGGSVLGHARCRLR